MTLSEIQAANGSSASALVTKAQLDALTASFEESVAQGMGLVPVPQPTPAPKNQTPQQTWDIFLKGLQ